MTARTKQSREYVKPDNYTDAGWLAFLNSQLHSLNTQMRRQVHTRGIPSSFVREAEKLKRAIAKAEG